jgi:methionyl-tRNA formyltransferase
MKKPKIIFMGTPEIAVPTLEKLHEVYTIQAVITVPDKPKGRGLQFQFSPVKQKALELNLEILQPAKLNDKEFVEKMTNFRPDIIVVFAFRILPPEIYNLAKVATFNIHTSLLPKYRGAAPINWAIINGEKISGLTSFILDEKIDTGAILLQKVVNIPNFSTAGDLHDLLMSEAPEFAVNTCNLLLYENHNYLKQNENFATKAPKIFRETAEINWNNDAIKVANFINGYSPNPCAWTTLENSTLKIYRVLPNNEIEKNDKRKSDKVGTFYIYDKKMFAKCKNGFVEILEIQQQGKKKMYVSDFINGYRGKEIVFLQ